jgi:xylulokinase
VNTLSLLKDEGIQVDRIRAVGGGTRSHWWTQLKSDLIGAPIEVSTQPEPGTLGAALLAGYGIGLYNDLDEASQACSGTSQVFEPDASRAGLHRERLETYRRLVPNLLSTVFDHWR